MAFRQESAISAGPNGTVYNGYWFWGRPSTADLWRDLREVTRTARPDWDLATPGVREDWEGDKMLHYPSKAS